MVIFTDDDGSTPLLEWLDQQPTKVQDKSIVRIDRLGEQGHELRRPEADYLRDGIYELRIRYLRVNYRILYFFHESQAVLSHGTIKEGKIPEQDIELALTRYLKFQKNPGKHTYREVDNE